MADENNDRDLIPEIVLSVDPQDIVNVLTGMRPDGTPVISPLEEQYLERLLEAAQRPTRQGAAADGAHDPLFAGNLPQMKSNASFWENLVDNFKKASKDPLRTGVYALTRKQLRQAADKLRALVRGGDKSQIRDFLKVYEIRPRMANQTTNNLIQTAMEQNQQAPAQGQGAERAPKFQESMIDPQHLKLFGLSVEWLKNMGHLDLMLRGGKTNNLIPITIEVGGIPIRTEARLSLRATPEGSVKLYPNCVRKAQDFTKPYMNHVFSDDDWRNLTDGNNMGRAAMITNRGESYPAFISVDPLTNETFHCKQDDIKIFDEYYGTKLDDVEKDKLASGQKIWVEGLKSSKGTEFDAFLQVNAQTRRVEPIFLQNQSNYQVLGGVELSEKQQNDLKAFQTVKIEGMKSKNSDTTYDRFVHLDRHSGRPVYTLANPETGEVVIPKSIGDQVLPKEDHEALAKGEAVFVKDMTFPSGDTVSRFVKIDQSTGIPMYSTSLDGFDQAPEHKVPQKIWDVPLNAQQRAALQDGDSIRLEGMTRHDGQKYSGWIIFDKKYGTPTHHDSDPFAQRKAQGQNAAGEQKQDAARTQKQEAKQEQKPRKGPRL